jgi:glutathione S-transferase
VAARRTGGAFDEKETVLSLTLYGVAASRASRPLWMLEELGVPYEQVPIHYRDGGTRTPEHLALNPNGHIPVLVDGDTVVWESMATTLYLARRFGGPLAPADLAEEAEALRWSFWAVTECEKDALAILFHRMVLPPEQRKPALADAAEGSLSRAYKVLEAHLASRDYIAADRFTVADLNVASVLAWAGPAPALRTDHPRVADWLRRCLGRPAQKKVREMAKAGR